ncbi:abortive infection system antitoxin AbiGi family protein [Vibrio vulnificus]|uniref:abortive infection system antitoxin AbiGi family protein n=1 Tax=Vibrio vulnificus TaxID=672 RepID=UPI003241BA14
MVLFHFTNNKETLKLIFNHGYWPRYCLEDIRWVNQVNAPYMAFPMVCFCDIPLSRISEHVSFYGNYGLGRLCCVIRSENQTACN